MLCSDLPVGDLASVCAGPHHVARHQSLTEDIAAHSENDIDSDVKLAAYRERLKIWHPILKDRLNLNRAKALRLQVAQILLATGMLLISVLLFTICRAIISGAHT